MQLIERKNGLISEVRPYVISLFGSFSAFLLLDKFEDNSEDLTLILPKLIPIYSSIKPSHE